MNSFPPCAYTEKISNCASIQKTAKLRLSEKYSNVQHHTAWDLRLSGRIEIIRYKVSISGQSQSFPSEYQPCWSHTRSSQRAQRARDGKEHGVWGHTACDQVRGFPTHYLLSLMFFIYKWIKGGSWEGIYLVVKIKKPQVKYSAQSPVHDTHSTDTIPKSLNPGSPLCLPPRPQEGLHWYDRKLYQ